MKSASTGLEKLQKDFSKSREDASIGTRLMRIVNATQKQTRDLEKCVNRKRCRKEISLIAGIVTGLGGLAGSILISLSNGQTSSMWWLTIPTWLLAATPIVVLKQNGIDTLEMVHARSAGVAALAQEVSTALGLDPHRNPIENPSMDGLEALVRFLEQDLEAISHAMLAGTAQQTVNRRHRRIVPKHCKVFVTTGDGRRLMGNISNISLSGVAMKECLPRLMVGDNVHIGKTQATVARCWDKGIAFEFRRELDTNSFDENIVL